MTTYMDAKRWSLVMKFSGALKPHEATIRPAVAFAFSEAISLTKRAGIRVSPKRVVVTIQSTNHYRSGRATVLGSRVKLRVNPRQLIGVRIERDRRYKDAPEYIVAGVQQSIVAIAAHEFRHTMGAEGGRDGERQCELFAARTVQQWRERENEHPACLI